MISENRRPSITWCADQRLACDCMP